MKTKILVFFICLCAVLMCGCSVQPQYTISQNTDGTISQMVYIPFSGAELQNAGVDLNMIAELSALTKNTFDNYFLNMYNNFVTRVNTDEGLSESDKMALFAGCPSSNDISGKGAFNGIEYKFTFASAIHYYYFNMGLYYNELVEELKKDESVTQHSFFTNKIITTTKTIYGVNVQYDENGTFAEYITNTCRTLLKENTALTDEQIEGIIPKEYIYRYGTPYKRLHSDADLIRDINGVYYHEWNIDIENSDREISTWRIYANQNVWYVVILASGVVLTTVLIIIYYVKNRKKQKSV